jgi:hypothetical protein
MISSSTSGVCTNEMKSVCWKEISTSMFIATLFMVAKIQKQYKWLDKRNCGMYTQYYCVLKKEETPVICNGMDETGGHYAKWKKPDT